MSKITILIVVVVLTIIGGFKLYTMRRPLPFQEVIALDKGIAVVNAQKWIMDDLQIAYLKNGKQLKEEAINLMPLS